MSKHVVATVDEIAPGQTKLVTVKGREIGVFNVGGAFYALLNRCPHEGGLLCEGIVTGLPKSDTPGVYRVERKGELVRCPWHGWEFDIKTGQSYCDPEHTFVRTYNIEVEPGEALAKGPVVAETFPVTVEKDYLVVEV